MRVRAIDHVQLAMPKGQEPAAIAFYDGLLGIANVPKPGNLAGNGGCWFEDGPLKVHLGVEADFRPARKAHPALLVDGLGKLLDRLRAAGIEITEAEPLDGYDRAFVHDPFGNRIEMLEPTPVSVSTPDASATVTDRPRRRASAPIDSPD